MPKRKKYPRLPNGFGSIRYLGKGRKNPYGVYPPSDRVNEEGNYLYSRAICYVDDWYVGFAVLNAWRAGTYKPGDEFLFRAQRQTCQADLDDFCARILADHSTLHHLEQKDPAPTFAQVYDKFYSYKYEEAKKKLSKQSRNSTRAAFKNSACLHDRIFRDLKLQDFQNCVNAGPAREKPLSEASLELMISLYHQMAQYATSHDICERDYTQGLYMPDAAGDQSGVSFTPKELRLLWDHKEDPTIEMALILCYSGWRIEEARCLEVDLKNKAFTGGNKTKAGKSRTVPIHSLILPFVRRRMKEYGCLLPMTSNTYRSKFHSALKCLGIPGDPAHTPHDCRHTFSSLCEHYEVAENDRKRMLGHSFGSDITNKIYGHRTLAELRAQIEKIGKDLGP